MASDNDDVKDDDDDDDDDDTNSKDAEVVEIGIGETLTVLYRLVHLNTYQRRKELSCRHEIQIREKRSAKQKAKPYQGLF